MTICYWQLCHCPDAQPCVEHSGHQCSQIGNTFITDEHQVSDANTQSLEQLLSRLQLLDDGLLRLYEEMQQEEAELKRRDEELKRNYENATTRAQRESVADDIRSLFGHCSEELDRFRRVWLEAERIEGQEQTQFGRSLGLLMMPFSDPTGYCSCYTEKRARLDALSQKIATEQAWIAHLLAELQGIGTVLFSAVLPELGIIGLAGLAIWALFGWTLPAFWPIVLSSLQ
jgi:hypothetical protein